MVESMGGIILRTSLLNPSVRLSPHSASDILKLFGFCSCECSHDKTRVLPLDFLFSSCYDYRQCDVSELAHCL